MDLAEISVFQRDQRTVQLRMGSDPDLFFDKERGRANSISK